MTGSKHSKTAKKRQNPGSGNDPSCPQARLAGRDERRWNIIEVDPTDEPRIIQVTVGQKRLLLVSQRTLLKVHVNPDPDECDEWNGVPVFSPPPDDSEYRDALADIASKRKKINVCVHEITLQRKDGTERQLILPNTAQVEVVIKGDNADDGKGDRR